MGTIPIPKVQIDYDALYTLIKKKGYNISEFCILIGQYNTFLSESKKRGYMRENVAELIANILGISVEDIKIPKESTVKEDVLVKYIVAELGEVKGLLNNLSNQLNEIQDHITIPSISMLNDTDKALLLLKEMFRVSPRVEERDFINKCNSMGVDDSAKKYAIEKNDCRVDTVGYGKNSKRVIVKKA